MLLNFLAFREGTVYVEYSWILLALGGYVRGVGMNDSQL